MIIPDRKKAATIIISRMSHPKGYAEGGEVEGDGDGDLVGLAEQFCQAIEAKDYQGVADAFEAMFSALEAEPHDEFGE